MAEADAEPDAGVAGDGAGAPAAGPPADAESPAEAAAAATAADTEANGGAALRSSRSRSSRRSRILRLAGSKLDRSTGDWMHVAPTLSQYVQLGRLLSHFVFLARHTARLG